MTNDIFSSKTHEELMLLYQQGEVCAFEVLYQRHYGMAGGIAMLELGH